MFLLFDFCSNFNKEFQFLFVFTFFLNFFFYFKFCSFFQRNDVALFMQATTTLLAVFVRNSAGVATRCLLRSIASCTLVLRAAARWCAPKARPTRRISKSCSNVGGRTVSSTCALCAAMNCAKWSQTWRPKSLRRSSRPTPAQLCRTSLPLRCAKTQSTMEWNWHFE